MSLKALMKKAHATEAGPTTIATSALATGYYLPILISPYEHTMKDPLPVPDQLSKQLAKCKSIRDADTYYKSREKTPQEIAAAKAKLPAVPTPKE
eukprot:scaffold28778_cov177-Skeletonema_menzelii.AAC.2